jgi:regulator of RNase E activity RraA
VGDGVLVIPREIAEEVLTEAERVAADEASRRTGKKGPYPAYFDPLPKLLSYSVDKWIWSY